MNSAKKIMNQKNKAENKEDVVKLMDLISEKYPNTNVYVQKIFPVGPEFHVSDFNEKIEVLNGIIENHVNTLKKTPEFQLNHA